MPHRRWCAPSPAARGRCLRDLPILLPLAPFASSSLDFSLAPNRTVLTSRGQRNILISRQQYEFPCRQLMQIPTYVERAPTMLKISIKPQWLLSSEGASQAFPRLLELLAMVEAERSIAAATAKLGVSYRHAWGLIRQANKEFGAPVLDMTRGRRATLSALGEKLLAADRRIKARITPLLDSLAPELEAEIARSRSGPLLRIHASHGYAIELMRQFLLRRNQPSERKYRGSMEAIASLAGA